MGVKNYSHTMNKQSLIIIIFIAIIAWVVWQYFMPAFDNVSGLREELKTWQGKLDNTQALSRKLEELKKKYDNMANEADKVAQAVTKREDFPGLLVQLEELSSQNGLILESVTFDVVDIKKNNQAVVSDNSLGNGTVVAQSVGGSKNSQEISGLKILAVNLNLNGSQNSLKTFLQAIEANLRIMDVSAISFGAQDFGASLGQDFKVSLNTYFRE